MDIYIYVSIIALWILGVGALVRVLPLNAAAKLNGSRYLPLYRPFQSRLLLQIETIEYTFGSFIVEASDSSA
jgi:hypothetical protein